MAEEILIKLTIGDIRSDTEFIEAKAETEFTVTSPIGPFTVLGGAPLRDFKSGLSVVKCSRSKWKAAAFALQGVADLLLEHEAKKRLEIESEEDDGIS